MLQYWSFSFSTLNQILTCFQQIATNVRKTTTHAQLMKSVLTRLDLTRVIALLGTLERREIVKVVNLLLLRKRTCFLSIPILPCRVNKRSFKCISYVAVANCFVSSAIYHLCMCCCCVNRLSQVLYRTCSFKCDSVMRLINGL